MVHVCACIFWLQKKILIWEWGFRHFFNCLDNQEEKTFKNQERVKNLNDLLLLFLSDVGASLVVSCSGKCHEKTQTQKTFACKKTVLQEYWRVPIRDTRNKFSADVNCVGSIALCRRGSVWAEGGCMDLHWCSISPVLQALDNPGYTPPSCFSCVTGKKQYIQRADRYIYMLTYIQLYTLTINCSQLHVTQCQVKTPSTMLISALTPITCRDSVKPAFCALITLIFNVVFNRRGRISFNSNKTPWVPENEHEKCLSYVTYDIRIFYSPMFLRFSEATHSKPSD